jgi:hypothetical protein
MCVDFVGYVPCGAFGWYQASTVNNNSFHDIYLFNLYNKLLQFYR